MAGRAYFLLEEAVNIRGVKFPAGPREVLDDGWSKMLREAGAVVLTEQEFDKMKGAAKAAKAVADDPGKGNRNGAGNTDGRRHDQSPSQNSSKRPRSRSRDRRVQGSD